MLTPHIGGDFGFLLRDFPRFGHVSCGTNPLTRPPLIRRVRRVALAALGRCTSCEERRDLADYPIYILSSAECAVCGTSRKATRQRTSLPILQRFWQLSHVGGDAGRRSRPVRTRFAACLPSCAHAAIATVSTANILEKAALSFLLHHLVRYPLGSLLSARGSPEGAFWERT
jgi:hypothetical protein